MTKAEQKQIKRATAEGRGAILRALANIHHAGSLRTQKEIIAWIFESGAQSEFSMLDGVLMHRSSTD